MSISLSQQGLQRYFRIRDPENPQRHYFWTNDYTVQLPIFLTKEGNGAVKPFTLIDGLSQSVNLTPTAPALSKKVGGKWQTLNYGQYWRLCQNFGKALMRFKVTRQKAVNINGFNSPQWNISFFGSIFANCFPIGVYTSNGPEACRYVADHSQCQCVVVQNNQFLQKYLKVWDQLPNLKVIVVYQQRKLPPLPAQYKDKVLLWDDFIKAGAEFKQDSKDLLKKRMQQQQPGNCCTIVYTSGTTGPPKGVMLSHDNYTWLIQHILKKYKKDDKQQQRFLSFLPLSHSAAQISDIVGSAISGAHLFFADESALQGSLVQFLKQVRPTIFFSVPRIWQKIEQKMKLMGAQNGFFKRKIAQWAKSIGVQGTYAQLNSKETPFGWSIAKSVVYENVKKALGMDKIKFMIFGAAPLAPSVRQYFLSLNIFLINGYGMSECAGPETFTDGTNFEAFDKRFLKEAGVNIEGTEIKIDNPDKDGNGQICFRGRNRFMGYYKDQAETLKTIDKDGFIHSGDVGRLDPRGNLFITGRIKQLIITAGGQNVAPVLIETVIKEKLPFLSNCVVIGDRRKFLSCLLTLKLDNAGKLTKECIQQLQQFGVKAKSVAEAVNDGKLKQVIEEGIKESNKHSISKAQNVTKWILLQEDFSIQNGTMTPTMKLKRSEISKRYREVIQKMYAVGTTL